MSRGEESTLHSNLNSFLHCTTPTIHSHSLFKSGVRDLNSLTCLQFDKERMEYFKLADLWDCYDEWSAYGAGVPIFLNRGETLFQYYVPYLSAIQIYTTKSFTSFRNPRDDSDVGEFESDSWSDDSESDKLSRSLSNNSSRGWDAASEDSSFEQEGLWPMRDRLGYIYCQYFEKCSPYGRIPFMDKINELTKMYPGLMTLRSVDLCPASWMAVAWYPIYHIPAGRNRNIKELSACFLTYHTLSSSFQDNASDLVEDLVDKEGDLYSSEGEVKVKCKGESNGISLRPFGLATYKMQGKLWTNPGNGDHERIVSLYSSADSWLKQLRVQHHDFNYFCSHSM